MQPSIRFLITLVVAGFFLLSTSAQHTLILHVAVAHAAAEHHTEPPHGHEEVAVQGSDHSHHLVLDLAAIARMGSGAQAPQAVLAELPPAFASVEPPGPVDRDQEPNPRPHPLERHPSLRL